jgi:translocation and assembly module TamB
MSEKVVSSRRLLRMAAWIAAVVAVLVVVFGYLRSDAFRDKLRGQVVAAIADATGGKVELKRFTWNLSQLNFDLYDLTIHGTESSDEIPYAHVDHVHVAGKVISLLRREVGVQELDLQHPVFHLIVRADGTTNQPTPRTKSSGGNVSQRLFALRMDRLRLSQGLLLLNDQQIPLDLQAEAVTAGMNYRSGLEPTYNGRVQAANIRVDRPGFPELVSKAQADFAITRHRIAMDGIEWSTAKSTIAGSATITDWFHPRIEATYRGMLDLVEVGKLTGQNELRSGTAELSGKLHYLSTQDFFSAGSVRVKNAALSRPGLHLATTAASSDYTVDPDRITFNKISGQALGGNFTGSGSLLHWVKTATGPAISAGRFVKSAAKPQEGIFALTVSGTTLSEGARAVLPAAGPLNRLRIASKLDGRVGVHWIGSPAAADVGLDLNAQAMSSALPAELPLTGTIHATYHGRTDRIDVPGLNLAGRSTRLSATGSIGAESELHVSLNTSDLSELTPVMKALGSEEGPLPAIVHGQASFNGYLRGKLAAPVLAGHLQATDFDTLLPPGLIRVGSEPSFTNPHPIGAARLIHWDSLTADISYSPTSASARNVLLKRGKAQITGWENAGLVDGQLQPESPLEIQIGLHNTDLKDLEALGSGRYPITGTVEGNVRLTGTRENLNAQGRVQLTGGSIFGEPYRSFSADLRLQGEQADLSNILLQQDGGKIIGNVSYALDSEAFSFDVTGTNFDLAHINLLQNKTLPVAGRAEFAASGSGTPAHPQMKGRVSIRGLNIGGEAEGDLTATAVTQGSNLHLEGKTQTSFALATVSGDVGLDNDLPAQLRVDLQRLDFDPLLRAYLAGRLTGHSSLSGNFLIKGPLKQPRNLTVTADLSDFYADIQNIELRNQGPLQFSVGNGVAGIGQLHIVGTDTEIIGKGTVELAGMRRLDLHGNGHINLAALHTLNPSVNSAGQVSFTLNATGTIAQPSFAGNVQIANGALSFADLPNGLSEVNGTLSFDLNRLRVQKLTAKTGGGDLTLGGYVTYSNGIFFDLTASGRDVRIRYPEGVSSQATADLHLTGGPSNSVLSGDVTITKFGLTPQFDLATYVQKARQLPNPPGPNSPIDNVRLDIHIVSTPELRVETSLARLTGDVDIRLRGTAARPSVMGRVNIAEGDIVFNGTSYHLERGDIVFANPVRIEPVINLEASARVRDYDITLGFHGTPDKLTPTFRSEPPLPSADIIALLAFGRTRQESEIQAEQGSQAATEQSFAQTASNAVLGEALNSAVSSRVQKLFGISRIKIDPNLGGTEDNPNARLTVEQQISKNVTVTYLTNLGQYAEQVLQVEYNINKNVSLVAVRDYTGVLAIDFRIRQRKR